MLINILLLVLIVLRLVISIRLWVTARQNNLPNLNWLALHFFVQVIGLPFAPSVGNPLGNFSFSIWLFIGGTILSQVTLIVFNHTTFYQGRKSPVVWYSAIFIITTNVVLYGILNSESNYNQSPWVAAYILTHLLIWGWHAWLASQAQTSVAQELAVEDWIKSRYQLIVIYSILIIVGTLASFVRIVFVGGSALTQLGTIMGLITLILQIVSVILQFLVWVLPEGFRKWLNRNNQEHVAERIHEKAIAIFDILGSAMTNGTGLTRMLALHAIRTVIGNQIQSKDVAQVEAHALKLDYEGWQAVVNDPELYNVIHNSSANASDVIRKAKQALVEKQSLFTLQSR